MDKIYYKVVVSKNGKLYSCLYNFKTDNKINTKNLIVEYKINEWAKPNIEQTSLMCFDSLQNANIFITNTGVNGIIYKCKIKDKQDTYPFLHDSPRHKDFLYEFYFNMLNVQQKIYSLPAFIIPEGTIFAKQIMLLERVL